ncbi:MAG: arylamine N-acetyltransferase, partial [Acinetobacter sp.]
MNPNISLSQRYLNKLGISQSLAPTLDNLKILLSRHLHSIPFGNVDSFLGNEVSLDIDSLSHKLLEQDREGYCLEHSSLIAIVLRELGYDAFNVLARVYYEQVAVEAPNRTHLVTVVRFADDQLFLFDPNFGGMTPTQVLSLDLIDEAQHTPHENFRFIAASETGLGASALTDMKVMLQVYLNGRWLNLYALNPEQIPAKSDIMIANWFVSTSPKSLFTQDLIFSVITDEGRVNFRNGQLSIYGENKIVKRQLTTFEEIQDVLTTTFKLNTQSINFKKVMMKLERLDFSSPDHQ